MHLKTKASGINKMENISFFKIEGNYQEQGYTHYFAASSEEVLLKHLNSNKSESSLSKEFGYILSTMTNVPRLEARNTEYYGDLLKSINYSKDRSGVSRSGICYLGRNEKDINEKKDKIQEIIETPVLEVNEIKKK